MKRLFFGIFVILLNTLIGYSQSEKYLFLVDKVCSEINPERIKNLPPQQAQAELMKLGNDIKIKYQDEVDELVNEIKEKNPTYSDNELMKEYFKNFIFCAIDNCPVYYDLMLMPLGECPEKNESLELIKKETVKFLNRNSGKRYFELNNLVAKHITNVVFENIEIIEKEYKQGMADPKFMSDMNSYLFHNSKKYLKVTLSVQIDKMYESR
jgi:hypothetical protein